MHIQRVRLTASLLGIAGLFASAAATAAVIHHEASDGDFSDLASAPTSLGALALGASTVTGRLPVIRPESGLEDPFDAFRFVVAAGTQVSAIKLNFAQGSYPRGASIALGSTGGGAIGGLSTASLGIVSGDNLITNPLFGFSGPLVAGDYTFALDGAGAAFGLNSYSFNFSVDPVSQHNVPEPASGLLVAGSLLALAVSRSRRRA